MGSAMATQPPTGVHPSRPTGKWKYRVRPRPRRHAGPDHPQYPTYSEQADIIPTVRYRCPNCMGRIISIDGGRAPGYYGRLDYETPTVSNCPNCGTLLERI